jgi:hypothetical protein
MSGHHGESILNGGTFCLWILSVELALCHPSGTYKFQEAPRVLESLCIASYNMCLILLQLESTCAHNFVHVHSLVRTGNEECGIHQCPTGNTCLPL